MNEHLQAMDQIRSTLIDFGLNFGPKVLVAIAITVVGVFAGRWLGRLLEQMLERFELEPPVRQLLVRVVRVLVLGLFAIMALQNLGVELLPLIAGIGLAGAGVALAMQGVLSNVAAGLTIIFTKPFRVGEYISIVHEEGQVETVGLFTTVLAHADRSRVVIPNRKIVGEILHNYGTIRQVELAVGIAYDTDLNHALGALDEILQANPKVLKEPEAVIAVSALADSSVNVAVRPWVNVSDYGAAGGEINRAILETFRGRNIAIPFPQREVRLLAG
jgi:small conductance mechanosensitive channel